MYCYNDYDVPTYASCIKDETGCVVAWCVGHSPEELNEMLENHPEWYLSAEQIGYGELT